MALNYNEELSKKRGKSYWTCQCDCGNIIDISAQHLIRGLTRSCGCLRNEILTEYSTKHNRIEYDDTMNCCKVYFNNCDEYFLCDYEDEDIARDHCWCKNDNGYAISVIRDENGVPHSTRFHRKVMERKYGDISDKKVDHKNHDRLDNRKDMNLRLCSNKENQLNRRAISNTGEKYISYIKGSKKSFKISLPGEKCLYVEKFEDAIEYRDNYIAEHPNDFWYDKKQDVKNNAIKPFKIIDSEKFFKS